MSHSRLGYRLGPAESFLPITADPAFASRPATQFVATLGLARRALDIEQDEAFDELFGRGGGGMTELERAIASTLFASAERLAPRTSPRSRGDMSRACSRAWPSACGHGLNW